MPPSARVGEKRKPPRLRLGERVLLILVVASPVISAVTTPGSAFAAPAIGVSFLSVILGITVESGLGAVTRSGSSSVSIKALIIAPALVVVEPFADRVVPPSV